MNDYQSIWYLIIMLLLFILYSTLLTLDSILNSILDSIVYVLFSILYSILYTLYTLYSDSILYTPYYILILIVILLLYSVTLDSWVLWPGLHRRRLGRSTAELIRWRKGRLRLAKLARKSPTMQLVKGKPLVKMKMIELSSAFVNELWFSVAPNFVA